MRIYVFLNIVFLMFLLNIGKNENIHCGLGSNYMNCLFKYYK